MISKNNTPLYIGSLSSFFIAIFLCGIFSKILCKILKNVARFRFWVGISQTEGDRSAVFIEKSWLQMIVSCFTLSNWTSSRISTAKATDISASLLLDFCMGELLSVGNLSLPQWKCRRKLPFSVSLIIRGECRVLHNEAIAESRLLPEWARGRAFGGLSGAESAVVRQAIMDTICREPFRSRFSVSILRQTGISRPDEMLFFEADFPIRTGLLGGEVLMNPSEGRQKKTTFEGGRIGSVSKVVATENGRVTIGRLARRYLKRQKVINYW